MLCRSAAAICILYVIAMMEGTLTDCHDIYSPYHELYMNMWTNRLKK